MSQGVAVSSNDFAVTGGVGRSAAEPPRLALDVLAAFDEAAISWCLVRGGPEGLSRPGDVDVLVAPADIARAIDIMRSHGFIRLRSYGRGTHAFFLGLDPATRSWVEFDLVTEIAYGRHFELVTGAEQDALARRQSRQGLWTLAPDDEFWTLLLHCAFDKGAMPEHHERRLAELSGSATMTSPIARAIADATDLSAVDVTDPATWRTFVVDAPAFLATWRRTHRAAVTRRTVVSSIMRALERPLQAWSRRGAGVALLGPDGAGKSTLASGLEAGFYFPVRQVYMGLWASSDAPTTAIGNALRILLRPLVVWRRYLRAVWHQSHGRLVVFDRYVYDALLPPRGAFVWLKRPYFLLLSRLVPAPSLVILLDAPGGMMHRRSGEYDPDHLEAEREHYRGLRQRITRLVQVDASQAADLVLADAVDAIWQLYTRRANR